MKYVMERCSSVRRMVVGLSVASGLKSSICVSTRTPSALDLGCIIAGRRSGPKPCSTVCRQAACAGAAQVAKTRAQVHARVLCLHAHVPRATAAGRHLRTAQWMAASQDSKDDAAVQTTGLNIPKD